MRTLVFLLFAITHLSAQEFDGYALYNSGDGNNTFLIDKNGEIAHRWSCKEPGGYSSLLTKEGNLMRSAVYSANRMTGAATSGRIQCLNPEAEVIWDFIYSDVNHVTHHDICLMPNNGVLLIAWERIALSELKKLGFQGDIEMWPTQLIEVQPDGNGGGKIVWQWRIIDHLIQDVDPTIPNFGNIAENPQLMDINVLDRRPQSPVGGGSDWFHVNGVDYNEEHGLIVFSSRFLSEILVIDHSTSTVEAAGHSGGNFGMGGDILYRWGNPQNYKTEGFTGIDEAVHDPRFIPDDGRFRGGWIQFFNNQGTGNSGSTVDAINPPLAGNKFIREPGKAFGPDEADFRLVCRDYARGQSAADAMRDGNTFVNLSYQYMYEVDKNRSLVWQYPDAGFKAYRYNCDYPGIQNLLGSKACVSTFVPEEELLPATELILTPNPSDGFFEIRGISVENPIEKISVTTPSGKGVAEIYETSSNLNLSHLGNGIYFVKFEFQTGESKTKVVSIF